MQGQLHELSLLVHEELSLPWVRKMWNLFNVDLTQVCSGLDILHCSLRANGLTATGAIALARTLQHNKSLEELE